MCASFAHEINLLMCVIIVFSHLSLAYFSFLTHFSLLFQYNVVEYPNGGVVVVPSSWLNQSRTQTKYPPKGSINVGRMVAGLYPPKKDWPVHEITFHSCYSKFRCLNLEARGKINCVSLYSACFFVFLFLFASNENNLLGHLSSYSNF